MFDVFTFGAATRDVILKSKEFRVHKDSSFDTGYSESFAFGSKVAVDEMYTTVGGGGINTATTFARQGFITGIVSKVGQDEAGRNALWHLQQERIATDFITASPKAQTAYSTVLLGPQAERTVLAYRGNAQNFAKNEVKVNKLEANWYYLTSLAGQMDLLKEILEHAKKKKLSLKKGYFQSNPVKINIALNPGNAELSNKDFPKLLQYVDILIMNKEEAHRLIPRHAKPNGIFPAIFKLMKGICIITDGTNGAACSDGTFVYFIGVPKSAVIDRLGAGDAFGSGFVSGYIRSNGNIDYSLQLAVTNASSVCEHHGATTGIITPDHKISELSIKRTIL